MENWEDLYPDLDENKETKQPETPKKEMPKSTPRSAGQKLILEAAKKLAKDAKKLVDVNVIDTDFDVVKALPKPNPIKAGKKLIRKTNEALDKEERTKRRRARELKAQYKQEALKQHRQLLKEDRQDVYTKGLLSTIEMNRIKRKEQIGNRFKIYNIISSRLLSNKDGNLNVEINPDSFTPSLDEVAANKGVLISKGSYKDGMKQIIRPQKSTAVQSVTYDPKTNTAWLTFVGGNKQYAYNVTPYELELFANAGSKGRWVNKVWKIHNRKEGY